MRAGRRKAAGVSLEGVERMPLDEPGEQIRSRTDMPPPFAGCGVKSSMSDSSTRRRPMRKLAGLSDDEHDDGSRSLPPGAYSLSLSLPPLAPSL
mmetsp:Transcript_36262/g.116452  ORF Transcript_36262/g.116452 Transcript_36262/m.116452 type:complete len:94 (-) Transcript_36262:760-1041(-)